MKDGVWGFGWGAASGIVLTLLALLLVDPAAIEPPLELPSQVADPSESQVSLGQWLDVNLGHSVWLFALVLTLYVLNLRRLSGLLSEREINLKHVVELDQLSDVWIHLFVGIGVIWTAVGMRSALQTALGDPGEALVDTAGSVLQKLVDGGILLALTTTIVGGVGGYVMRLAKTMVVGAELQEYYDRVNRFETRELLRVSQRIEAGLAALQADEK